MNGIFVASDRTLHDVWHQCLRRGADCTAARIQREMADRAISAQDMAAAIEPRPVTPIEAVTDTFRRAGLAGDACRFVQL